MPPLTKSQSYCNDGFFYELKNEDMNKTNLTVFLFAVLLAVVTGCKKDEEGAPKPVIQEFELGHDNTKTVVRGEELHMDVGIVAEGKISEIYVEIHHEGDHGQKSVFYLTELEWEFDSVYTIKYAGAINVDFHEDIEVPLESETGHYHFYFSVTDMLGQRTSVEDEIEVLDPVAGK
jgi:hypothetical protein